MKPVLGLLTFVLLAGALSSGCAIVPQNRRGVLADRSCRSTTTRSRPTASRSSTAREGAAGGDGAAAGGGCGCQ